MGNWTKKAKGYRDLIGSADWDSGYLRERGLIRNILDLVGDCQDKTVLDAGAGNGWLFDRIRPKEAHACDLVTPEDLADGVEFRQVDVNRLCYANCKFDIVVASLLLIFCAELPDVLREFHRVSRKNGRLVVAIMHPYFYRTGEINADGSVNITECLSKERQFDLLIGGRVGPFAYFYRPLPTT